MSGATDKPEHECSMSEHDYGFYWCGLGVTRCAEINGRHVLRVGTDSKSLDIYVSPTGRSVRVFSGGRELK